MNDNLLAALIKGLNRNADAMERMADAQEENNRIMREDINLIRDANLDDLVDEQAQSH